jgi:hypothetical protein
MSYFLSWLWSHPFFSAMSVSGRLCCSPRENKYSNVMTYVT